VLPIKSRMLSVRTMSVSENETTWVVQE
jgi:hypothetical protein